MARTLRIAIAAALLLVAGNAAALGLGQIEVKSKRNQPLLAEIPIISTTPGELEALQARLASPETFRRVGLAPPTGIASDLQFSLGSDARGRPVIRVTTLKPVDQAVLNFLIEVDWGQGRLVREYSALVDAPRTAGAPVQPAVAAPVVQAPAVVRRPAPAPVPATLPPAPARVAAVPAAPPARPAPTPAPVAAAPEPAPRASAVPLPAPTPAPPRARAPAPAVAAAAPAPAPRAEYGPVKPGETLSVIAGRLDLPTGYTLDQAMLALLRANPDAFLGNDINRLKRGAVLRLPAGPELGAVGADEARLVVREQMRQWQQAHRAVAQPVAVASGAPARAAAPAAAPTPARASAPATPARTTDARLQIVPPSGPGKATATASGTSAGGEGSMLQQQLQQRDEEIATKAAEIGELKERVAELEQLKQQQAQLLAMKDSELAAAQQRLANARTTAPATAAATQERPPQPAPASASAPWLWGGLAVLVLGVLAWLFARRKPAAPAAPVRRGFDSAALAASLRAPVQADADDADDADAPLAPAAGGEGLDAPAAAPAPAGELATVDAAAPAVAAVDAATDTPAPAWHDGRARRAPEPPPAVPEVPRFVPAADTAPASAAHRLKLARAFQDIGDDHSARQLLRELLDDADPAAREDAARMLRELG
ncbi:MAG TPA: FimV/HubP family polar landmark protein [Thermomonas sp.]|nr:FimV/HubP family polar landmark protein [Thermomonas sp.]